jgi:hypothetical protein
MLLQIKRPVVHRNNYIGSLLPGVKNNNGVFMVPLGIANASNVLRLLSIKRHVQPQSLPRGVCGYAVLTIGLCDELLAACIYQQSDKIRTHVVASEVSQRLGQVVLVKIDLWYVLIS